MASDWIKALEEKERVTSAPPVTVVREDEPVVAADDAEDESTAEDEEESSRSDKTTTLIVGGVVGAVLLIGVGSVFSMLSDKSEQSEQDQAEPAVSTTQQAASSETPQRPSAAASPTSPVEVGNACPGKNAEMAGEESSVRDAVAQFEKAYFERDAQALAASLAKNSPLQQQDWKTILPEAAPEGTTWCVEMAPVADGASTVDVDLTMAPPGEESALYRQTVKGEKDSDKWVITSMEEREG
ncbi:cytoskeletal protein RodZ [Corynebacterium mucifaciens]|uniref:Cytoskeletal protein RodZ n=1 Tax=Corynebacterium mucifaciens TaxID=57171 RepID=A0ABV2P0B9_9CORY